MILKLADLLDLDPETGDLVRVVWLSPDHGTAALFRVADEKAFPVLVPVESLENRLRALEIRLVVDDPYQVIVVENKLKDSNKRKRDRAWSLIQPLVENTPDIFNANRRGALVQDTVNEARKGENWAIKRTTKALIYGYLRRYWQRGMTANALLPDYDKCGGRGKIKKAGDKKRGRPRKYGIQVGINVTSEIRRLFSVAFDRYYATTKNGKHTLKGAFNALIRDFFSVKSIDTDTGRIVHLKKEEVEAQGGLPTIDQFVYWSDKDHLRLEIKRKRMGPKLYDKDMRGLLGTSNAEVMGPGSRYQIDATIADVFLVSRLDPNLIIGRPVLYIVIDVFSRMIVGLYVGLEGPSWVAAMMALANTAMDKVAFCAKYGIPIEPEDWPCHHLPGIFLGDRGEMESDKVDTLINSFNVKVENTSSYRADWKGIVESRFRLLPAAFKPYTPGYIDVDYRQRGGHDYRLDAVLNLDDFMKIIINCVLHYNNVHEITTYDFDRDVKVDGVPAIPAELWDWGIRHRSGALRTYPEELVQFSLMPTDSASVTTTGIAFRGRFYTCPLAIEERWFDKARQDGRWRVTVSYDPRDVDTIYLHTPGSRMGFSVCTLTDRSRADQHLSSWEIDQIDQRDKHGQANRRTDAILAKADTDAANEEVIEQAKQRRGKPSQASAASQTNRIRENRAKEKAANREGEAFRPGQTSDRQEKPSAEVIQFPGNAVQQETDYSLPTIDEILGGADEDA
ncbi:Mu transposase C-terminal domain-containing protein [Thermomonas sp. HDW16]|uniref:Mu transposase C-terminal domain-containing protein n=1 Tax=Thermomonas sp. HDW16 TaxID=2714945 RepID=UPI00140DDCC6|nr:Mu transposase C-terminal domain-containing protein [Thermomonas sp. HDW16]QIL19764.1 transposase [Thermomonas sp. HDW16]